VVKKTEFFITRPEESLKKVYGDVHETAQYVFVEHSGGASFNETENQFE
jgi:hypothetical protein